MRILLVHRYYWPDIPTYAQMLRFLSRHLADGGHDVTIFCGPSSYNGVLKRKTETHEVVDGVAVRRVRLPPDRKERPWVRTLSMLMFAVRLVGHVVRNPHRYDVISVTTIPPVVMGVAARVIRRLTGTPYLYHCMDLYPEVAVMGEAVESRALVAIASKLDVSNCRQASHVVVLSDDMRATLCRRGCGMSNVQVLNNFDIEDESRALVLSPIPKPPGTFRVLFAGNLGRFQALEDVVEAARRLAPAHPGLEIVFMGTGIQAAALRRQAADLTDVVRFLDHQPLDVAMRVMEESDLGIVSLRPGIYRVAYPSKTMMYLKAGCRILAVVEAHSELACFVRRESVGAVCPPGDVDALVTVLESEIAAGEVSDVLRHRSRACCNRHFGRPAVLARWTEIFREIEAARP